MAKKITQQVVENNNTNEVKYIKLEGKQRDTRTGEIYSEVVVAEENAKYFEKVVEDTTTD